MSGGAFGMGRSRVVAPLLGLAFAFSAMVACGDSNKTPAPGPQGGTGGGAAGKGGGAGTAGSSQGGTMASGGAMEGGAGGVGGSSAGNGGKGSGGKGGKGSGGAQSGSSGSAGSSGQAGGHPVDRTGTSMPDADLEGSGGQIADANGTPVDDNGAGWLKLLSSHYYTEPDSQLATLVERWLGLVENTGPGLLCNATLFPSLYDDQGELIVELDAASVATPTYRAPGVDSPWYCLEPGERAVASALFFPAEPLDTSRVAEVGYGVSGFTSADAERYDWVTLENDELVQDAAGAIVRGTLVNGGTELSWWRVNVFALGSDGVPLAAQDLSDDMVGIDPALEWDFETAPFQISVLSHETTVEHSGPR